MFFRSERLFLRPAWPEDRGDLAALLGAEPARCLPQAAWLGIPGLAGSNVHAGPGDGLPHFLITLPGAEGPRLIGLCGLDRTGDEVELSVWIGPEHRGRGFAGEAGRAVLTLSRALGHERVVAGHRSDDPASARVLRKLGFLPTGRILPRPCSGPEGAAPAAEFAIDLAGEGMAGGPDCRRRAA